MNGVLLFILLIAAAAIPAYILGSINGAIIASRVFYRKDIRDYGSGNAGLTNFYRVFGKGGALTVILIDVIKTVLPVSVGGWLFAHYLDMERAVLFPLGLLIDESFFGQALAGFAVILGHCFPVFYKFRGGKGVMAIGAIVFIIDWRIALIAWGVFLLTVAATRYVSLGAILGSIAVPVSAGLLSIGGLAGLNVLILCVLLIVVRHAENIKRIMRGEESKFRIRKNKEQKE